MPFKSSSHKKLLEHVETDGSPVYDRLMIDRGNLHPDIRDKKGDRRKILMGIVNSKIKRKAVN